jgi:hypothetical protein
MRSDTARNRRADPLAETIAELKLPALGDEALFLWNMFFDPREILDLVDTVRLSPSEAADRLTATLRGALTGWAKQVPRKQASTRHAGPRPPAVSPGRAAAPARRDRRFGRWAGHPGAATVVPMRRGLPGSDGDNGVGGLIVNMPFSRHEPGTVQAIGQALEPVASAFQQVGATVRPRAL